MKRLLLILALVAVLGGCAQQRDPTVSVFLDAASQQWTMEVQTVGASTYYAASPEKVKTYQQAQRWAWNKLGQHLRKVKKEE